jgi:hypothetical protein
MTRLDEIKITDPEFYVGHKGLKYVWREKKKEILLSHWVHKLKINESLIFSRHQHMFFVSP